MKKLLAASVLLSANRQSDLARGIAPGISEDAIRNGDFLKDISAFNKRHLTANSYIAAKAAQ